MRVHLYVASLIFLLGVCAALGDETAAPLPTLGSAATDLGTTVVACRKGGAVVLDFRRIAAQKGVSRTGLRATITTAPTAPHVTYPLKATTPPNSIALADLVGYGDPAAMATSLNSFSTDAPVVDGTALMRNVAVFVTRRDTASQLFRAGNASVGYSVTSSNAIQSSGNVAIQIFNNAPVVPALVDTVTVTSEGVTVPLLASDADSEFVAPTQEIAKVRVFFNFSVSVGALKVNGAMLTTGSGKFAEFPATVAAGAAATKLTEVASVTFSPGEKWTSGSTAEFTYTVLDTDGAASAPARVQLRNAPAPPPMAIADNTTFTLSQQKSPYTVVDLRVVSPEQAPLRYIVTQSPEFGTLVMAGLRAGKSNRAFMPQPIKATPDAPVTVYQGPSRRVRLMWAPPPQTRGKWPAGFAAGATVRVTWRVEVLRPTGAATSDEVTNEIRVIPGDAKSQDLLTCGPRVFNPVFWDHPVTRISLNYTSRSAETVDTVVLLSGPVKPVGDLWYFARGRGNNSTAKAVRVLKGSQVSDRYGRLEFVPKPVAARAVTAPTPQTFEFLVKAPSGATCRSQLTFVVSPHDVSASVRREVAPSGRFTLLQLRGNSSDIGHADYGIVVQTPSLGQLYTIQPWAPYDVNATYREVAKASDPLLLPYCERHNCTDLSGERVEVDTKLLASQLVARDGTVASERRIWLMYQAPPEMPEAPVSPEDVFALDFCTGGSCTRQTYRIELYQGKLRRVLSTYRAKRRAGANISDGLNTLVIPVTLGGADVETMVMPFDVDRRHGSAIPFRMYQAVEVNGVITAGEELVDRSRHGIRGKWVENANTVILIPESSADRKDFRFRARVFPLPFAPQRRELVRYIVSAEDVAPPTWKLDWIDPATGVVAVGAGLSSGALTLSTVANDNDVTPMGFKFLSLPLHGTLTAKVRVMDAIITRKLHEYTDQRIVLPRGADATASLVVEYEPILSAALDYPLDDNFTVVADNGGDLLSEPLTIRLKVLAPEPGVVISIRETASEETAAYGGPAIQLLGVGVLLAVGAGVFVTVRRRRAAAARGFEAVGPRGSTEMTTQ